MKLHPSLAKAIAILSSDTACIIAETNGTFSDNAGSSPFLNLTSGVFKLTFSARHSVDEYPGTNKYSLKVCDGSSK